MHSSFCIQASSEPWPCLLLKRGANGLRWFKLAPGHIAPPLQEIHVAWPSTTSPDQQCSHGCLTLTWSLLCAFCKPWHSICWRKHDIAGIQQLVWRFWPWQAERFAANPNNLRLHTDFWKWVLLEPSMPKWPCHEDLKHQQSHYQLRKIRFNLWAWDKLLKLLSVLLLNCRLFARFSLPIEMNSLQWPTRSGSFSDMKKCRDFEGRAPSLHETIGFGTCGSARITQNHTFQTNSSGAFRN